MPSPTDDLRPQFDVKKRTTKVNIAIVVGVVLFLAVTGLVLLFVWRDPPQTPEDVIEEVSPD